MHGLLGRFWYYHYRRPICRKWRVCHGAVAKAIADGDVDGAGRALDKLLDNIEAFTRATITEI
jgi:DNA-binding GntR family transcriptional regulator